MYLFQRLLILSTISLLFFLYPLVASANGCINNDPCWEYKASMPTARREIGTATDAAGNIYVVGGYDGNGNFLNTLEMYDPNSDSWSPKAFLPTARNALGFIRGANGHLFAVGGFNGTNGGALLFNELDEYSPESDTWNIRTPMPTKRYGLGFTWGPNGKLYAIGGGILTSCLGTVEEYDIASGEWTTKNPMPTPRCYPGIITTDDGMIYVIGGSNSNSKQVATVEEYDPINDVWYTKSSMPTARTTLGVALNNHGRIYAVGGDTGDITTSGALNLVDIVEEYDTDTNTWVVKPPLPVKIHEFGLVRSNNDRIFLIGGQTMDKPATNTNLVTIETTILSPTPKDIYQKIYNDIKHGYLVGEIDSGIQVAVTSMIKSSERGYDDDNLLTAVKFLDRAASFITTLKLIHVGDPSYTTLIQDMSELRNLLTSVNS